jgi:hypothetical protein
MIRKTPRAIRDLCLSLAAMLPIAMAAGTCSAATTQPTAAAAPTPAPAAAQADEKLQQLEQIWAHGKRLAHRIEDAEDEFFPLYNKVNKNDDYDIKCGYAYLSADTMIMGRACVAGFLGKDYGPPPVSSGSCYGTYYYGGYYTTAGCDYGGFEPLSIAFIVMAKSEDMRKNMTRVITNDPVLLEKAAHLGDLYLELSSIQNRFRTVKGIKARSGNARPVRTNTGPRTL